MTTTYLVQTSTTVIAADGTATVTFTPQVGQFWAPSIVRVSTRVGPTVTPTFNPTVNASYCALYHGASSPGAIDATAFLDDTFKGSGDTSSVIAGTVVLYGEVIVVKWSNAVPGVTAMAIVYGRTSDNLVELQGQLSPIPGAKFSGNSGNALVWNYSDVFTAGPLLFATVAPGLLGTAPVTISPNLVAELVSINFDFNTNATAGGRQVGAMVQINDGTQNVDLFRSLNTSNFTTVSSTGHYCLEPGVAQYNVAGQLAAPIPPNIVLPPGTQIRVVGVGIISGPGGDTVTNWSVVYRQFNTLGKVTFT